MKGVIAFRKGSYSIRTVFIAIFWFIMLLIGQAHTAQCNEVSPSESVQSVSPQEGTEDKEITEESHLREPVTKVMTGTREYSYEEPHVNIPGDVSTKCSPEQISELETKALSKYEEAMQVLEESYADLAVSDKQIELFINEVCSRLYTLVHVWAELNYEENSDKMFGDKAGVTLEENRLLANIFLEGRQKEWMYEGQTGSNPLAIRRVLTEGNFREKMVLIRFMADGFVGRILEDVERTERINNKLRDKGHKWHLHQEHIPAYEDLAYEDSEGKIYHCGIFAQIGYEEKLRKEKSLDEIEQWQKDHSPTIIQAYSDLRVPLSDRECRYWTKSPNIYSHDLNRQLDWSSGATCFKAVSFSENPSSRYLQIANKVKLPLLASVSGTADRFLTQLLFLGFTTKEEFYKGRLAVLGHLINSKSHSSHEVLFASKSFGLIYTPGPRGYKTVFPVDPDFLQNLQQKQRDRGYELPDYYLSDIYLEELSRSIA